MKTTDEITKDYVENWFPINKKKIKWFSETDVRPGHAIWITKDKAERLFELFNKPDEIKER